jgi:hypothetical protein
LLGGEGIAPVLAIDCIVLETALADRIELSAKGMTTYDVGPWKCDFLNVVEVLHSAVRLEVVTI